MDANYEKIKKSLNSVAGETLRVRLTAGVLMLAAACLILLLAGLFSAVQISQIPQARTAYLAICTVTAVYIFYRYILAPILPLRSEDRLALLIEKRLPGLKDLIISSLQLNRDMENPQRTRLYSHELISLLFRQTAERLEGLRPQDVVERQDLRRNLKALWAVVSIIAVITILNPAYVVQRFNLLLGPRYAPSALIQPATPVIGDITLTYRYPAYTGLEPKTIKGTSGDIRTLKGSEVDILARSSRPVASAGIIINDSSRVAMTVEEPNTIKGSLIALENGNYSFETLAAGSKSPQKSGPHRIIIEKDAYPEIKIISPISDKVVSEGDMVGISYEAADDFGLREIRLVAGEGPPDKQVTKSLKVIKGLERDCRGSFNWNLSELKLVPGQRLPYYLEAVDNDAVSGPKTARSKTRYLEVYSMQKRHYELLSLQDRLLREMTQLLAEKLVHPPNGTNSRDELLMQQEILINKTADLLTLFDRVLTEMEDDALANYAVFYSLENIRDRISQLNSNKEKKLNRIEDMESILPAPVIAEVQAMQEDEIVEQENDILFLVELLRKQRLDDILNQDRRIEGMEKTLTSLQNDLEQGKTGELDNKIRQELQKLEEMIKTMLDKLTRLSSNWGDEFLNLEALKSMGELNLNKDIQDMKDALDRGDFEAALEAALRAVNSLQNMLAEMDKNAREYADSTYSRTLQEMNSLDKMLRELEEGERRLAQQTEKLKKDIQSRTFKEMDRALSGFFEKQLNRLNGMKDYLSALEKSLSENTTLNEYSRTEKEVNRLLKKRDQAMRSPFRLGAPDTSGFSKEEFTELNKKLRKLNEARNQDPLLDTYDEISNTLPKLREKLSQLNEMLQGQDVKESLNLARESLRDLRYMDYMLDDGASRRFPFREEMMPPPGEESQKMRKDTGEKLAGARDLNKEMVKDLESVRTAFDRMRRGGLTEAEKELFGQMAGRQDELENHAQALAESLDNLAGANPSIGSEANEKLREAKGSMGKAEGKLRDNDGQSALEEERDALYKLSQARKSLGEATERMARGMMSRGIPMPRYVLKHRSMWGESGRGFSTGEVDIPTEEAYKVPREFRQDILDAMKKGLPERYQELNKDYYRKLVE